MNYISELAERFDYIDRGHGFCWRHKTKPCWIVFYSHTTPHHSFYEAYIVKQYLKMKAGREPWSHDNSRLSNGDGFKTLEEAMAAVEEA